MSFQGRIEDVAVADVMQLIRLGGHSGTLSVHSGEEEEALIGFERGRIVSAWSPQSQRLGELLVASGAIDEPTLAQALQIQESERPHRALGQILSRMNAASPEAIRDALAKEIERVVTQILGWPNGTFEFALDDLTPVVEVTRFSGAPKVDLDTQQVLLDALQRMEEEAAGAAGPPEEGASDTGEQAPEEPGEPIEEFVQVLTKGGQKRPDSLHAAPVVAASGSAPATPAPAEDPAALPASERPRFQLVSPDTELLARLNQALAPEGERISTVALRDAGASLLGEAPPIVIVDLRYQVHGVETLAALCRTRPRASVIALFEGRAPLRDLYKAGVVAISSVAPDTVVACMRSVARQRRYLSNEHAIAEGIRASFARLRRIIADLRSGLLATSVSLNLLNVVAESLDRGVLFVPDKDNLVAIGAFGQTALGDQLVEKTRNMVLPVRQDGVLRECLADSKPRRSTYEQAGLPTAFAAVVDRPLTGEIAILPVPGSERVIAIIYLDNGARDRPVGDIEIFELAAFQLGLALENEFLRRANPDKNLSSSLMKMRKMG